MKKKAIAPVLALLILLCTFFALKVLVTFNIEPSPDGDYEILTFMIDEGGAGYDGIYFLKEKGLFSKWHIIRTGTCSCTWLSETEIEIYHSTPQYDNPKLIEGELFRTKHNINEFLKK